MADTNDLKVIVSLDIPKSVPVIEKDLRKLENILANNSKNGKLNLVGRLDPEKTKNIIEKQLASLKIDGSKLKITPQLDVSGKSDSQIFKNIQDSANTTKKTIRDLRQELLDIDKTKADFRFKAGINDDGEDLKKTLENARKLFSAYKDIDDIQFKWSADESGEVNKISAIIKSVTGQVETLRFELQQTNGVYNDVFAFVGSSSGNTGITKTTKDAEKLNATLKAQEEILKANANALKAQWEDSNGGKSVRNEEHVAKLTEKYNELIATIGKLRGADKITATEIKGNIKAQETEIKSLISVYHNAEKVATSLRARDTETSIINTKNNIREFMSNFNASKVSFTAVEDELQKLAQAMQALDGAASGDKAARLRDVLNAFENLQTKFKAENTIAKNFDQASKSVEKVITDLNTMSRTQIFNTHSNNAGVIEFQGEIKSLSDTAKQVKADLNALGDSKAIPPELRTRVEELKQKFDELNGSNKTLQANLRQNDGWARTERQIQTLTARIKEYMAVNTKASSKYKSQFDGLFSGLSQAEMNKDSEAVRRLSADFQILQHTIKAAGDQGKTLGQTIVDNAKRFSSWMTLTGVISTGWRELRKMVSTVIELDTAMTNLRKVTNETEGTYSKFLKDATTQAKELGMAVTDLIDSTSDFAKLGYSLPDATELAKVASVYANVGELNISDATSSLVSTLAAFKMEAKDAMSVIDKFNAIGNSFSITSADIGEALQRSASSLHTANNTLDESIALITAAKQYWLRVWKHTYRIHLTALIA